MFKEGNVTVMGAAMERAVRFYTETLGLPLKTRVGDGWAEVQAPRVTIALHPAGQQGPPRPAAGVSIGLIVEELEPAMAALREKGVAFAPHLVDNERVRLAFFTDPDQTPLYLCEYQSGARPHS